MLIEHDKRSEEYSVDLAYSTEEDSPFFHSLKRSYLKGTQVSKGAAGVAKLVPGKAGNDILVGTHDWKGGTKADRPRRCQLIPIGEMK